MDSKEVQLIREAVKKVYLDFTGHAKKQLYERKIRVELAKKAVLEGKVLERQEDEDEDVKILFQEASEDRPQFCVVVTSTIPPRVVTAFKFDEERWEYDPDNNIWRRK